MRYNIETTIHFLLTVLDISSLASDNQDSEELTNSRLSVLNVN